MAFTPNNSCSRIAFGAVLDLVGCQANTCIPGSSDPMVEHDVFRSQITIYVVLKLSFDNNKMIDFAFIGVDL